MDADYSQMTHEEEHEILRQILDDTYSSEILAIGDVYSILREHFNNRILDTWAEENPEKAYPKSMTEEEAVALAKEYVAVRLKFKADWPGDDTEDISQEWVLQLYSGEAGEKHATLYTRDPDEIHYTVDWDTGIEILVDGEITE
jgi:hypothetical protein